MTRSKKAEQANIPPSGQLGIFQTENTAEFVKPPDGQAENSSSQTSGGKSKKTSPPSESLSSNENTTKVYSVSEITWLIQSILRRDPVLGKQITVRGELSNVKKSSRGHVYFTLKDEGASINGILWASQFIRLPFKLEDGMEVFLSGALEIYAPSGSYSIVAKKIEPVGQGPLQLAFQQIKARLEAEGLFLEEYKKPLPDFPERIGIVTSRTGAVIHDMLRVIRRKNPLVDVLVAPVKVQGDGASAQIADAIRELNHPDYNLDLLIVARGGGSFEDLFCFSEEPAVRAVFESRVPVITGVGHEPDYSLADAAADYSSSTPTAAAEHAVPDVYQWLEHTAYQASLLVESMHDALLESEQTLDYHATRLLEYHQYALEGASTRITQLQERLLGQGQLVFQKFEQETARRASELHAFSPLETLARGYAIATDPAGAVIHSIQQAKIGDVLTVRVFDGDLPCKITAPPINRETLKP